MQTEQKKAYVKDGCMITYTGKVFDLMNPRIEHIDIIDIAHQLANTCRWQGATKHFFSVAEHCTMMYDSVPEHLKAVALFHDAEEAYWGDFIRPIKNLLPIEFREKMKALRKLIFKKYSIPQIDEQICYYDDVLLEWDYQHLIEKNGFVGASPRDAKSRFLTRFYSLQHAKLITV